MSLAQSFALRPLVCHRQPNVAGSRGKLQVRAVLRDSSEPQLSKTTTCDLATVQTLQKRCAGLSGTDMEACWAESGCDVNEVTKQFYSVVGEIKRQHEGGVRIRGHGRLNTVSRYASMPSHKQQGTKLNSLPVKGHGRSRTVNHYK
uniref:Uncharacterized protein n=1 Tax=Pyramimonas obovata TaxID=1411642 RepID=A0A6T7XEZ6_9CHLO|mmetsp:Transcript_34461/g.75348  ORF Transcript_34461/g.75348 Transcript_34461/m.75348 type:complete len:146 (+) Transcript_34461:139-576(+)|eukprot:CAMPEP_0118920728 /NCGR_PEP_ID=MMETSP1169-20130426/153_1 /TAXON_ID=36882 /ORGANISM="Pyramimonas obovata, Strain CCMP722" /LENGTH=145 /DNA_ID=CAMNT_0006861303 /DNA_START=138 /DNA_END=575 /DNA_ORIENTATION=-